MSIFFGQEDVTLTEINDQKMQLAEFQYDTLAELQKTLFKNCATKCIPLDYGEGELNKGEMSCTDRCVAKFMQSYKLLSMYAQNVGFNDRDLRHYEAIKTRLRDHARQLESEGKT